MGIEITNPVHLIKVGEKVGQSESALLSKLNIKPFTYGLGIRCVYDNGSIFSVDVLNITPEVIIGKFSFALSRVAAISLQIGYPTQASVPHSIGNAFKVLVAAPAAAAAAPAAAAPVEEEVDALEGGMDMFG